MKYRNSAKRLSETKSELVMILIDFSPSMEFEDFSPSRLEAAIQSAVKLIETKAKLYPQDKVGVIAFDNNAYLLHPPVEAGKECSALCQSLRKDFGHRSGTNFTAALELAEKYRVNKSIKTRPPGVLSSFITGLIFETSDGNSRRKKNGGSGYNYTQRVIMLSDGEHNGGGSPITIAQRIKYFGTTIECIGIAGSPEEVDENMLKSIASIDENGKPRYCFIGDTEKLINKYKSMAHHIRAV